MTSYFGLDKEKINKLSDNRIKELNEIQEYISKGGPNSRLDYGSTLKQHGDIIAKYDNNKIIFGLTNNDGKILESNEYLSCSFSYMFLISLGIENLLKGILVYHNPKYITEGILYKELKTHDLKKLHGMLGFDILSNSEVDFLEKIQFSINSRGRYPVPLKHNQFSKIIYLTPENKVQIDNLYIKIHNNLKDKIEGIVWESGVGVKCYYESENIDKNKDLIDIF